MDILFSVIIKSEPINRASKSEMETGGRLIIRSRGARDASSSSPLFTETIVTGFDESPR